MEGCQIDHERINPLGLAGVGDTGDNRELPRNHLQGHTEIAIQIDHERINTLGLAAVGDTSDDRELPQGHLQGHTSTALDAK